MPVNYTHKKILVAPLDWGLGHASRCIPLIKYFQKKGCKVIIAAEGKQLSFLQSEFPGLEFIQMKGYRVNYTKHKRWLPIKILWQGPKILARIKQENALLQSIIAKKNINLVISDNRYGLHSNRVPCIFITHQLTIKTSFTWQEIFIQKINYSFIRRFTACWVPDFEGMHNLAGALSHPKKLPPLKTSYLGPLSRFAPSGSKTYKYKYLFILSGPEPQRTILEQKILNIIDRIPAKSLLVLAKPGEAAIETATPFYTIKPHLATAEMQSAFEQSEYIISRSGYTTIMELLVMGKKSLLIPTPGQTEQEYLAGHLMEQHWCYSCSQEADLLHELIQAEKFEYRLPVLGNAVFEKVVDECLDSL